SWVRPDCLPAVASRRVREPVARGSMPYSAVTQPWPLPRSQPGTLVSTEAVHRTLVLPKATRQEPSAFMATLRSRVTARISEGCRPDGRIMIPVVLGVNRLLTLIGAAHKRRALGGWGGRA